MIALGFAAVIAAAAECRCPASPYAEAGARPVVEHAGVQICGYLESRDGTNWRVSEFGVFKCQSSVALLEFDALQTGIVSRMRDGLRVVEVRRWPFGRHGSWIDVAIWEYRATRANQPVQKIFVFRPPRFSRRESKGILAAYERARARRQVPVDYSFFLGRLLGLAASGSAPAEEAYRSLPSELMLDSDAGEEWSEGEALLKHLAKNR